MRILSSYVCVKNETKLSNVNCTYIDVPKSQNKHDNTTTLHHYKWDLLIAAIVQQLNNLNDQFSFLKTELLTFCASLDPRLHSFNMSKICALAKRNYILCILLVIIYLRWSVDYHISSLIYATSTTGKYCIHLLIWQMD